MKIEFIEPTNKSLELTCGKIYNVRKVDCYGWYYIKNDFNTEQAYRPTRFKIVEEDSMRKSDLKTGMLVQTRNNEWYFVFKDIANEVENDIIVNLRKSYGETDLIHREFMPLSYYNENLTLKDRTIKWDIVKVAECNCSVSFFTNITTNEFVQSLKGFQIVWERKSEKEEQLNELIFKLESQLSEAKEELNKIKKS